MALYMERVAANLFRMDQETWMRHANTWSVWSRAATLPFLALAIWSRQWIGSWSLTVLFGLLIWLWLNPRIFRKPKSTNNWSSKATFGERILLRRSETAIPTHHAHAITVLKSVTTLGLLPLIYGLWQFDMAMTLLGLVTVYFGKFWFLDRMVWLYHDMKDASAEYRRWLY